MKIILLAMGLAFAGLQGSALACGFCGGDQAASVYSFKNKQFAARTNSKYVSVALSGEGAEEEFNRAVNSLAKVKGIYPKTVRSAFAQRAVSFVFGPDFNFASLAEAFSEKEPGWSMKLVEEIR